MDPSLGNHLQIGSVHKRWCHHCGAETDYWRERRRVLCFPTLGMLGWKSSESFVLGPSLAEWKKEPVSTPSSRIPASTELEGRRGRRICFLLMCQPRGRKRKQEVFVVYLKIFDFVYFDSVLLIHPINGQLGHPKVKVVLIDVLA